MRLWVVEMWVDTLKRKKPHWGPTVGVALVRDEGKNVLREWRDSNPDDKFRLVPYSPRGDARDEGKP
jgi:hypothetical protein